MKKMIAVEDLWWEGNDLHVRGSLGEKIIFQNAHYMGMTRSKNSDIKEVEWTFRCEVKDEHKNPK